MAPDGPDLLGMIRGMNAAEPLLKRCCVTAGMLVLIAATETAGRDAAQRRSARRQEAPMPIARVTSLFRQSRGPGAPERGFDMLRWFAALSLLCVVLSGIGTAVFLNRFLSEHMLMRDAEVAKEFIASIIRAERTWSYFSNPTAADSRAPMESFFNHVSQLPGVVRANVFDASGRVIWSSTPDMIGRRWDDNHELTQALHGHIAIESGVAPKTEHLGLQAESHGRRFTESYIPLWDESRRNIVGVVEIYRLPDALFRAIDEGQRLIWISAGLSAALLYGALLWIAVQARCAMARQQQRLVESEALAAIGAVASAVAHGIRNPLASIRSSAELAAVEEPEAARDCMVDIQREADRVDRWVRDLLLQAKGDVTAQGAVEVAPLLEEAARAFAAAAQRQGVEMSVEAPALPSVRADGGALVQAIDNLVANAIEAMPEGGALRLAAGLARGGRAVEVTIADTGPGLPDPAAEGGRLFFSTKPRGTGLGLVLTRRIVEQHGGALRLDRGPGGRGTTAVIHLPVAPTAHTRAA
jgi:signal transduction histidine kinase